MKKKEEIIVEYFKFLNRMYDTYYDLPDLDINEREWSSFFDTVYEYTKKKNELNFYYGYLYTITIDVLNTALLESDDYITLNNFIEKIDVLNNLGFQEEEIKAMQCEIREKASFGKVLTLLNYFN